MSDQNEQQLYSRAWDAYKVGQFKQAWEYCIQLQKGYQESARSWDISSRVALAMGGRKAAIESAERAVARNPGSFSFLSQQAQCLLALNRTEEAVSVVAALEAAVINSAAHYDTLGNLYSQLGKQRKALKCFLKAIKLEPNNSHFHMNLALVQQSLGDLGAAEESFDRVISIEPKMAEAWLHRSRLRTQTEERNHVALLQQALAGYTGDWRGEMNLRYALAKECEDLAESEVSFDNLSRASRLRRKHMQHDSQADLDAMALIQKTFNEDYFDGLANGCETREPIFIVGLPRTGTTLVERIIGAHSEVFAAGELNNFAECLSAQILHRKPQDRMQFIHFSRGIDSEQLGRDYVESTRPNTGHCGHFIDKLPLNFLYCGLIHRAMPNAKIIHLTRHPMDTCYAIYKTLFKQAYPFSYDLQELGNYYLAYRELMDHWHRVMPGVICDVSYEKLVSDQEAQSRRLIEYCQLPWQDECLQFHQSEAPSMTASLAQVRKPVYTSSVGRWKNYRKGLNSLERLLRESGIELD